MTFPVFLASSGGASDRRPDAFTFANCTGVSLSTTCISCTVTPTGYNAPAPISITGGGYSIAGGAFTCSSGTICPGQNLRLCSTSSSSYSNACNTTVCIGCTSACTTSTWSVTTRAFDFVPDNFCLCCFCINATTACCHCYALSGFDCTDVRIAPGFGFAVGDLGYAVSSPCCTTNYTSCCFLRVSPGATLCITSNMCCKNCCVPYCAIFRSTQDGVTCCVFTGWLCLPPDPPLCVAALIAGSINGGDPDSDRVYLVDAAPGNTICYCCYAVLCVGSSAVEKKGYRATCNIFFAGSRYIGGNFYNRYSYNQGSTLCCLAFGNPSMNGFQYNSTTNSTVIQGRIFSGIFTIGANPYFPCNIWFSYYPYGQGNHNCAASSGWRGLGAVGKQTLGCDYTFGDSSCTCYDCYTPSLSAFCTSGGYCTGGLLQTSVGHYPRLVAGAHDLTDGKHYLLWSLANGYLPGGSPCCYLLFLTHTFDFNTWCSCQLPYATCWVIINCCPAYKGGPMEAVYGDPGFDMVVLNGAMAITAIPQYPSSAVCFKCGGTPGNAAGGVPLQTNTIFSTNAKCFGFCHRDLYFPNLNPAYSNSNTYYNIGRFFSNGISAGMIRCCIYSSASNEISGSNCKSTHIICGINCGYTFMSGHGVCDNGVGNMTPPAGAGTPSFCTGIQTNADSYATIVCAGCKLAVFTYQIYHLFNDCHFPRLICSTGTPGSSYLWCTGCCSSGVSALQSDFGNSRYSYYPLLVG